MSTKHDTYPQVRIHPEVEAEIIKLQVKSGYKMSRTAYVDSILRKGIECEKSDQATLRRLKKPFRDELRKATLKELQG